MFQRLSIYFFCVFSFRNGTLGKGETTEVESNAWWSEPNRDICQTSAVRAARLTDGSSVRRGAGVAASGTGSLVFIDDVTADGSSRRSSAALWGLWEASEEARNLPKNCAACETEEFSLLDVLDWSSGWRFVSVSCHWTEPCSGGQGHSRGSKLILENESSIQHFGCFISMLRGHEVDHSFDCRKRTASEILTT